MIKILSAYFISNVHSVQSSSVEKVRIFPQEDRKMCTLTSLSSTLMSNKNQSILCSKDIGAATPLQRYNFHLLGYFASHANNSARIHRFTISCCNCDRFLTYILLSFLFFYLLHQGASQIFHGIIDIRYTILD